MTISRDLERGRDAYEQRAWRDAYEALAAADDASPLGRDDLERLATASSMVGRVDEFQTFLERLHHDDLDAGQSLRAARTAVLIGMNFAVLGEIGPAAGWFGRAQRLVEREEGECVERGYLLLPVTVQHLASHEFDGAYEAAARAAQLAEQFRDADLLATAMQFAGWARVKQGRFDDGLALLDEAMVGVTAGEVSPYLTGVVYCGVIACCEEAFEPRRAHEWTTALSRWCAEQPQMVAFTGRCLAHRAGISQLRGEWRDALEEARFARERAEEAMNAAASGEALYKQGELHRLQGDFAAAEKAYREASTYGREPQPGFALLRLAQGDRNAATAAIRRVLAERSDPLDRAVQLPAFVEIMVATGEPADAEAASRELDEIASTARRPMLDAIAAYARGAVALAGGRPNEALGPLRRALDSWQDLRAPYEVARTRVLVGAACSALGDADGAALELEAATLEFERLGARPDLERLAARPPGDAHGLTERELEVLRLVARGQTNRQIASELVVSEHTVARHVQNIFAKLRVSSRTAAAAFAFEHELV